MTPPAMTAAEFIELQGDLTTAQVAERLGVSESTITKWRGQQHPIPAPVAIAMRALFGGTTPAARAVRGAYGDAR